MEFVELLNALSAKIRHQGPAIQSEEAAKIAFVMPFINPVLGYAVFDSSEVASEYV